MSVKVEVTQKHIDNGIPCDPLFCPISLALNEQLKSTDKKSWIVSVNFAVLLNKPKSMRDSESNCTQYSLPKIAKRFIKNFDNKLEVKPITFELKVKRFW